MAPQMKKFCYTCGKEILNRNDEFCTAKCKRRNWTRMMKQIIKSKQGNQHGTN